MGARAAVWMMVAGVVGVQVAPWPLPAGDLAVAAGALLAGWCICRRATLACAALGLLAAAAGALRLEAVEAPALPDDHVARLTLPLRATLEGDVEEIGRARGGRAVVIVGATAVEHDGRRQPVVGRVRVTVRGGLPKLRAGDGVRVATTLRAPRNFANPGSFDLVGHLARRGIRVTASVWEGSRLTRIPRRTRGVAMWLARWRERLARAIRRAVPAAPGAVLVALIVGDEARIPDRLRTAFARTGVVHVLSVSGLHVGLVALASFAVVRWLLSRSERLLLALDVRRLAALLSLVPPIFYGVLAGMPVATLRSVLMAAVGVLAVLLGRPSDVLRTLALAALAVALAQPGAPREIGFQLSFVSVLAIVLGARRCATRSRPSGVASRLRSAVAVSASALVGTAPLSALHFRQIAPMGLLANPLVVPLFGSVVVVLGLVAACVQPFSDPAAAVLFRVAGQLLRPGIALVELLARPSCAAIDVPRPDALELALLAGVLAAVLLLRGRAAWCLGLAAALGLLADAALWARVRWAPGVLRVTFLDVGQGDASVAELPDGRVLVVDAGGFPGSDFDTGDALVAPYLATRKIMHVDALVMTHAHPDHSGGLPALLRRYRPTELWWTGWPGRGIEWHRLTETLAATGTPARLVHAPRAPDGYAETVAVLHPPAAWRVPELNETSLTLRLTRGDVSVLLTGDIEARAEASVLATDARVDAAVLKVPHHGSRTSSTPAFVDAVAPRIAVISVGAENRYRLPSAEVEARYRARGICVLRTDRCGAVTIVTDGHRLDVTTMRPGCDCN